MPNEGSALRPGAFAKAEIVLAGGVRVITVPATSVVTTLADEKRINTFMRLGSPSVAARLREKFPELPQQPDAKMVFTKLRQLRNSW